MIGLRFFYPYCFPAMEMLGITRYNRHPVGYSKDTITEDVFFDET